MQVADGLCFVDVFACLDIPNSVRAWVIVHHIDVNLVLGRAPYPVLDENTKPAENDCAVYLLAMCKGASTHVRSSNDHFPTHKRNIVHR